MNAVIEPKAFALPKKPRVKPKDAPPDQRKLVVIPFKAVFDKNLTDGSIRVLAALCSYCNRAGITWVSQKRLADEMKVSRQCVTNQLSKLRKHGYVEIVSKGFRGERCNTIRVVFDPTVDTATAIALTSSHEDTRPPEMKEKQMQDMTPDPEGQKRVAELVKQALKQPTKKEYQMPHGNETLTVQKMKAEIAKKTTKKASKRHSIDASIGNQPVSNESHPTVSNQAVDNTSIGHSTVSSSDNVQCPITHQEHIDVVYKGYLSKEDLKYLKSSGLSLDEIKINFECLRDAYKSEGLTLPSKGLVDQILGMCK